jgi:FG-GAP-like repeat
MTAVRILIALCCFAHAVVPRALEAQTSFVEITPTNNPWFVTNADEDFWISSLAPADIDADGDTDFVTIGYYVVYNVSAVHHMMAFINQGADGDGNWLFDPVEVPLGDMYSGDSDLAWGDFNGDGLPDLAAASEGLTVIYENSNGTLSALPNPLPVYHEDSGAIAYDYRSLSWADFDNDGDADLLVPSGFDWSTFEYSTSLVRNDGPDGTGGWLFTTIGNVALPTQHAQSAWSDRDGDGDLDLFLLNNSWIEDGGFIKIFDNDGGVLNEAEDLGIEVAHGVADWGDYDADGDMDILVCGNIQEVDGSYSTVLRVYTRGETGYASMDIAFGFGADWLDLLAATWADYDSDGDMDILMTGNYVDQTISEIVGRSEVFINNDGQFAPLGLNLPAAYSTLGASGAFTWLDVDNDGDLDYLISGAYFVPGGNGLVESQIHLYRNDSGVQNQRPTAPEALIATPGENSVLLEWNPAMDDSTASAALTYDLLLWRNGAPVPVEALHLPEPGGISAATQWELRGLAEGTYQWSVGAVDSAFNAGPVAEDQFIIGGVPVQVTVHPPAQGGAVSTTVKFTTGITNLSGSTQTLSYWAKTTDLAGNLVARLAPKTVTLSAGQTISRRVSHVLPAGLPQGVYIETLFVGSHPSTIYGSASFRFRKN